MSLKSDLSDLQRSNALLPHARAYEQCCAFSYRKSLSHSVAGWGAEFCETVTVGPNSRPERWLAGLDGHRLRRTCSDSRNVDRCLLLDITRRWARFK